MQQRRNTARRAVLAAAAVVFAVVAGCTDDPPLATPGSSGSSSSVADRTVPAAAGDPAISTTSPSTSPTSVAVPPVDSTVALDGSVTTAPTVAPVVVPPTTSTAPAGPTTTAAAPTTVAAPTDVIGAFIEGTAGAAGGTPVAIGWVNQEGGAPSFPEATLGLSAAVEYLNRTLGGIGGRLIEIHQCAIRKAGDGAACAQVLRDDPAVTVVIVGTVALGNTELLAGLRDVKPVVLTSPLTTADFLATDAVAYTAGSPGVINGLARFATTDLPTGVPSKVAVVYPFGLAGEAAFQLLAKPVFDAAGIAVVGVPVLENAAPATFAGVIRDAGAADAQVFLPILGLRGCIGLAQAIGDLASTATVLATDTCLGSAMTSHVTAVGGTGELPDGWYVGGTGFRFQIPGNPELEAYLQVAGAFLSANQLPLVDLRGYAANSFAALLGVVKIANALGPDQFTAEAARRALREFTGPGWGVVGPLSCGFNPVYPSLCGTQMGVERYVGGTWQAVADGYTGSSISLAD